MESPARTVPTKISILINYISFAPIRIRSSSFIAVDNFLSSYIHDEKSEEP